MNINTIIGSVEIPLESGYCVYFLTDDSGEILYVGQSNAQTLSRISAHHQTKEFSKAFLIKVKNKREADITEARLIIKIKPRYNMKIEMRREVGLINRTDIKNETGMNMSLVKKIAKENGIKQTLMGGKYWPEKLMVLLKKHIKDHPEKFRNKSINSIKK